MAKDATPSTKLGDYLARLIGKPKEAAECNDFKCSRLLHFFEFDFPEAKYIGQGSYGPVISGRNRVDKTVKAIKCMQTNDPNASEKKKSHMTEEAKVFCRLDCENIVRFFWVWIDKIHDMELICISMDYCQMDLEDLMLKEYQDDKMIRNYSMQLANGLAYLHGRRGFTSHRDLKEIEKLGYAELMHHDLKPDNVLVKTHKEGENVRHVLKLSDFGLTRPAPGQMKGVYPVKLTSAHDRSFFKAPELATIGERLYTKAIDCFAMGQILLLMLCLQARSDKFDRKTDTETANREKKIRKEFYDETVESEFCSHADHDEDEPCNFDPLSRMGSLRQDIQQHTLFKDVIVPLVNEDPDKRMTSAVAIELLEKVVKESD